MYVIFVQNIVFLPKKDALKVEGILSIIKEFSGKWQNHGDEKVLCILHSNCNILFNGETEESIHVVKYQNSDIQSIAKRASFLHLL